MVDSNLDAVPVRVIDYTVPYDGTEAGNTRLAFDAWIYRILIVFTIAAQFIIN